MEALVRSLVSTFLGQLSKEELTFSLWPPKLSARGIVAILVGLALAWRIVIGDFISIHNAFASASERSNSPL
jgi:hypothetical protein